MKFRIFNTIIVGKLRQRLNLAISIACIVACVLFIYMTITTTTHIMSCAVEKIVDTARKEISYEMEGFEYKKEIIGLTSLTPETNGNPIRSVILSTWRSGSSFFGQILNAIPGTYYFFEPLNYFGDIQLPSNLVAEAIKSLYQLLKCNFTDQDSYMKHGFLNCNTKLHKICKVCTNLCRTDKNFLSAFCRLFPFQAVKTVRLRAAFSEPLLSDPDLNIKIVLLIRDPRGIMSSRKHLELEFCATSEDCKNTKKLCLDHVSDYMAAQYLTKKYPKRFKVIRYEDLSLDPFKVIADVLNFYNLTFHNNVNDFLRSHTNFDAGNVMSTFRNSRRRAFAWRHNMTFAEIDRVQSQCTEAMDLWGYQKVDHEDELKSDTFFPLFQSPFDT